jgi:hypothetical protein
MDNWSAIAPMLIGFYQTAPQRLGKAKAMTDAASKSPADPIVTLSNCAAKVLWRKFNGYANPSRAAELTPMGRRPIPKPQPG